MNRPTFLFVLALVLFSSTLAQARPPRPRVIVRDEDADIAGLPAISGDGATVAWLVPFDTTSDAQLITVAFVRVNDGATLDRWLVHQRDDNGRSLAPPSDGRGDTPWRRARNLTLHLEAGGYRAMARVGEEYFGLSDHTEPLRGAGIRIRQRRHEVTIVSDRDRHVRWSGRLPEMSAFCGMSDDRPRNIPPRVQNAWIDARAEVAFLEYGHVYGSCMCPANLQYVAVPLGR